MREAFFWVYPWDLLDEGIDAAVGRIAGEIGADAIAVATTYHSIAQFRPHAVDAPTHFACDAGAHFQPDAECYAATRLRPIPAAWMKSRNPFERISEECRRRNIGLRAWTVCCHGSTMAARYPEAACKDVFGNRSASWICPANPDVREYVAGLVADLTKNYPLALVELESADFGGSRHVHAHEKTGLAVGPVEELLLSLCFCESCVQAAIEAGVDASAVRRSVRVHLEPTVLGHPARTVSIEAFLAEDDLLRAFVGLRKSAVVALIDAARQRSRVPVVVHTAWNVEQAAFDADKIATVCDGFVLPGWQEPLDVRTRRAAALVAAGGDPRRVQAGFACYPPDPVDGPTLVRRVHDAVQHGHDRIGFYNYGIAPNDCLDWVRQAIRFARREV